jgi:hypothetical protein
MARIYSLPPLRTEQHVVSKFRSGAADRFTTMIGEERREEEDYEEA